MKDDFPGSCLTRDRTLLILALIDGIQGLEARIGLVHVGVPTSQMPSHSPTDLREELMDTTKGEAKGVPQFSSGHCSAVITIFLSFILLSNEPSLSYLGLLFLQSGKHIP